MKIHTGFGQNSLEWLSARAGVVTASEFDCFLTTDFELRKGQMIKSYIARKVAERWSGPLPGFNSIDMDFGKFREEEAIPAFEFETGIQVQRVAFITDDTGQVGCSPDGLIGEDSGIEIKCPTAEVHTKYLLQGELPSDYVQQVHASMFVTGRKSWRFLSYRRHFPMLMLEVQRDDEIQTNIAFCVSTLLKMIESATTHLIKLNGGPGRPWKNQQPQPQQQTESMMPS